MSVNLKIQSSSFDYYIRGTDSTFAIHPRSGKQL